MAKNLKFFTTYYQCPTCWIEFMDTKSRYLPQRNSITYERKCEFCERNPTPLQIIKRQIEFLPQLQYTDVSNIGYFLQNLVKHIDLKE